MIRYLNQLEFCMGLLFSHQLIKSHVVRNVFSFSFIHLSKRYPPPPIETRVCFCVVVVVLLPCGRIVRCMFVQGKTSFQANISIFHCFIYYVNSSTEYFYNWLGHKDPPPPPLTPSLHVSPLHKGSRWTAHWWELPFGGR